VNPIGDPPLHIECIVIQPARRTLTTQARLFLERFEAEAAHMQEVWNDALAAPHGKRANNARRGLATRM
jgi:hypothetical protein